MNWLACCWGLQVKLETRIPAGFLQGLSALVPQASGLNLEVRHVGGYCCCSMPVLMDFDAMCDVWTHLCCPNYAQIMLPV